jgi:hypothetical protein
MQQSSGQYVISVESERFRKGMRYHWMISSERTPDVLVSWGYAETQEQAEAEARQEIVDLSSGLSKGGQVATTVKKYNRR